MTHGLQFRVLICYTGYPCGIHSFSFMLGSTDVPNLLFRGQLSYFLRVDPRQNLSSASPQRSSHLRSSISRGRTQILRFGPHLCYVACGPRRLISHFLAILSLTQRYCAPQCYSKISEGFQRQGAGILCVWMNLPMGQESRISLFCVF